MIKDYLIAGAFGSAVLSLVLLLLMITGFTPYSLVYSLVSVPILVFMVVLSITVGMTGEETEKNKDLREKK